MNSPAAGPLLSVAGLRVVYTGADGRSSVALSSLDLEVGERETIGVVGESGSGKSSLAQALLRLLPSNAQVAADRLCFRGRDMLGCSHAELRQLRGEGIALISQEPALSLNPVVDIGRQIEDVLAAHRDLSRTERKKRVEAILRDVGFDEPARIMKAYPHQLSGGQRQRAAIAQALICSPSLLIADEPLSALDSATQAEVLALLRRIRSERKLAMIFITHNARILEGLADRVLVMRKGEIAATGTVEELAASKDDSIAGLISPEKTLGRVAGPRSSVAIEPLMQVQGLSKKFIQRRPFSNRGFEITALNDVSFEVHQGVSAAIIGRSGSGKSTLARCLAGLEQQDRGEILISGEKRAGAVQMIFQDAGAALNPRFTASEVIAEPLVIEGRLKAQERRERVETAMEEVGLDPEWMDRRADEFSGGQKQRLALARALAANPRILILDEAFSGLDLPLQARMMRLVLELQQHHSLACIHITHDLNFVSLFASEVLVMDAGRIVDRTSPAGMLESENPVTQAIVSQSESLRAVGLEAVL